MKVLPKQGYRQREPAKMTHSVSVLITLYNHENYIQDAINSALAQTRPPEEIVVIDDASTDQSVAAARKLKHESLRILTEERNLGGPNTMKGLAACKGDFIAILNSDDTWRSDKLQRQLTYLENNPGCGAVFTLVNLIDERGHHWPDGSSPYQTAFQVDITERHQWLRRFFHRGNALCASSAVVRRQCFDKLGPLDGRYAQLQDLDMWIRIVMGGYDIHVIQDRLTNYRVLRSGLNMSTNGDAARALYTLEYARILRNFWKITSIDELAQIFPDIEISPKAGDALAKFYLAMYSSRQPEIHHQLFALESMSSWGGDYHAMNMAAKCHNFSHADYRRFLSSGPIRRMSSSSIRNRLDRMARWVFTPGFHQKLKAMYFARKAKRHHGKF